MLCRRLAFGASLLLLPFYAHADTVVWTRVQGNIDLPIQKQRESITASGMFRSFPGEGPRVIFKLDLPNPTNKRTIFLQEGPVDPVQNQSRENMQAYDVEVDGTKPASVKDTYTNIWDLYDTAFYQLALANASAPSPDPAIKEPGRYLGAGQFAWRNDLEFVVQTIPSSTEPLPLALFLTRVQSGAYNHTMISSLFTFGDEPALLGAGWWTIPEHGTWKAEPFFDVPEAVDEASSIASQFVNEVGENARYTVAMAPYITSSFLQSPIDSGFVFNLRDNADDLSTESQPYPVIGRVATEAGEAVLNELGQVSAFGGLGTYWATGSSGTSNFGSVPMFLPIASLKTSFPTFKEVRLESPGSEVPGVVLSVRARPNDDTFTIRQDDEAVSFPTTPAANIHFSRTESSQRGKTVRSVGRLEVEVTTAAPAPVTKQNILITAGDWALERALVTVPPARDEDGNPVPDGDHQLYESPTTLDSELYLLDWYGWFYNRDILSANYNFLHREFGWQYRVISLTFDLDPGDEVDTRRALRLFDLGYVQDGKETGLGWVWTSEVLYFPGSGSLVYFDLTSHRWIARKIDTSVDPLDDMDRWEADYRAKTQKVTIIGSRHRDELVRDNPDTTANEQQLSEPYDEPTQEVTIAELRAKKRAVYEDD